MHELLNIIKRAALEAYENEQMIDLVCGEVCGLDPFTVCLEGKSVPLMRREQEPELEEGDRVYLIRLRGGQKFLLLDKVVG